MSDYTPDTDEVRGAWEVIMYEGGASAGSKADAHWDDARRAAQFDRWLAEVERAAAEKAWDESRRSYLRSRADPYDMAAEKEAQNPYREGKR